MEIKCRYFSGYKPCGLNARCDYTCPQRRLVAERILIVHLEALGAVLRATSILPAVKRKYPHSHITWVTKNPAQHLLDQNPYIDRVLTTDSQDLLALSSLKFDVGLVVDKSLMAGGVIQQTRIKQLFGFRVDPHLGAILPATEAATELWQIGLSDEKKFFDNEKAETQLLVESLELGPFRRDEYEIHLSEKEKMLSQHRRSVWGREADVIVGINTGCSSVIPYKKLSISGHRSLIQKLSQVSGMKVVLLGGQEDKVAHKKISDNLDVICSPVSQGLRDGICSVNACDIVISGDSLGMHMGIGLKKWVVAWFGPTCEQEIDLYGRGVKVLSKADCSPCWKRYCQKPVMCYDLVDLDEICEGVKQGIQWLTSSSRQHSLATSYSPSL